METTKLSTKGQIVIPEKLRSDLDEGTTFIITRKGDFIILKKIEGLTQKEQKTLADQIDKILEVEKIASKSKLTMKDVMELDKKIKQGMRSRMDNENTP